jgi:uncharacterized protein YbbC (DUF1343 family)
VLPGIEVFLQDFVHLVKGKRVGLVTNPTGVDSRLESTIDLFVSHSDIDLRALFGPEHGVYGFAQAGEVVRVVFDIDYGLPVYSLYGQNEEADSEKLQNLDETMRLFDTQDSGKYPVKKMLENVDVLIFDLQDVGTRIYTYIATMAHCMQRCAQKGIDFIVLDRPNPINGVSMEGPLLDYPEYSSFVGMYSIPVRHGLTIGELAQLINAVYLHSKVDLTVIPMKSWRREMWFDDTGLPWIAPSPNMPTLQTTVVYPGQVFLEGTNISEGRGTALPFELFGAPWIQGRELARRLNRLALPGLTFRKTFFQPTFSKYKDELCQGCQLHIRERDEYRPLETVLHIIKTVLEDYPDCLFFHAEYFDAIMGSDRIRTVLLEGKSLINIVESFSSDLKEFENKRKSYLLY